MKKVYMIRLRLKRDTSKLLIKMFISTKVNAGCLVAVETLLFEENIFKIE